MEGTAMEAIFTAADISGLSGNVSTLALAFVGIALIGTGFYYVKKYLPGKK